MSMHAIRSFAFLLLKEEEKFLFPVVESDSDRARRVLYYHLIPLLDFQLIDRLVNDQMPPFNFSFVPPLQGYKRPSRFLPGCHQLGDINLKFQPISERNVSLWSSVTSSWAGGLQNSSVPVQGQEDK